MQAAPPLPQASPKRLQVQAEIQKPMTKRTYGISLPKSSHHFLKTLPVHSVSASEAKADGEHLRSILKGGGSLCGRAWEPCGFSTARFCTLGCDGLLHRRSLFVNVFPVYLYCLLAESAIILICYALTLKESLKTISCAIEKQVPTHAATCQKQAGKPCEIHSAYPLSSPISPVTNACEFEVGTLGQYCKSAYENSVILHKKKQCFSRGRTENCCPPPPVLPRSRLLLANRLGN